MSSLSVCDSQVKALSIDVFDTLDRCYPIEQQKEEAEKKRVLERGDLKIHHNKLALIAPLKRRWKSQLSIVTSLVTS